jgi:hypothetical protein
MNISYSIVKLDTLFKQYVQRFVAGFAGSIIFLSFNATAIIISDDDIGGFGVDALTRDTDQGLDFLDVTFSIGRSFNDVSGEFGIGGDFEGFRYASLDEVIGLANNFGVTPPFVGGNTSDINTDIAGLVDLLGATGTNNPVFNRKTVAMTSTSLFPGQQQMVEFLDEFDNTIFQDRISSEPVFAQGEATVSSSVGSYLVRERPIPEPGTLLLVLAGSAGIFGLRQQRKRTGSYFRMT